MGLINVKGGSGGILPEDYYSMVIRSESYVTVPNKATPQSVTNHVKFATITGSGYIEELLIWTTANALANFYLGFMIDGECKFRYLMPSTSNSYNAVGLVDEDDIFFDFSQTGKPRLIKTIQGVEFLSNTSGNMSVLENSCGYEDTTLPLPSTLTLPTSLSGPLKIALIPVKFNSKIELFIENGSDTNQIAQPVRYYLKGVKKK